MVGVDGDKIIYPSLDMAAELDEFQWAVSRGYIDHATGRLRHSDLDQLRRYNQQANKAKCPLKRDIAASIEDPRIERLVMQDYKGASGNLSAVTSAVCRTLKEQVEASDQQAPWYQWLPATLTAMGRKLNGIDNNREIDQFLAAVKQQMTSDHYQMCEAWAARIGGLESTEAALTLADEIFDAIVHFEEYGEDDPPETPENDPALDRRASEVGKKQGQSCDVSVALKAVIGEHLKGEKTIYRAWSTEFDTWSNRRSGDNIGEILRQPKLRDQYQQVLSETAGQINALRRKLERSLAAKRDIRWAGGALQGRLDNRRLVNAYNGEEDVFTVRREDTDIATAVSVLVDLSTSMVKENKGHLAMLATIALAEALEKTDVSYEILGFCTNRDDDCNHEMKVAVRQYQREHPDEFSFSGKLNYSRYEPINMVEFKGYHDNLNKCRASMAAIDQLPYKCYVGNCDGESLLLAYDRLRVRPEPRKVLMVLSDGAPHIRACKVEAPPHLGEHLKQVVSEIEADGVETLGIGIVDSSVQEYYPNHVVVNDVDSLVSTALDQVARILLGKTLAR